jgi:dolichol-phosphate mannosyltransferase
MSPRDLELSLLFPSRNEGAKLFRTIASHHHALKEAGVIHEFVIVNDTGPEGDSNTAGECRKLESEGIVVQYIERKPPLGGFGTAVAEGLSRFRGKAVVIVMADGCEDPQDILRFLRKYREGHDCVFGDRFGSGGRVRGYPRRKLLLNRVFNWFLSIVFWLPYRDFTNASKLYSRDAVLALQPIFSRHFNVTIELPLKAFVRGMKVAIIPNSWSGEGGSSSLQISSMMRRYLFTAGVILLEHWLAAGDYQRGK